MSYCHEMKKELCGLLPAAPHCRRALLYGILLFAKHRQDGGVLLRTENEEVCVCVRQLLDLLFAGKYSCEQDMTRRRNMDPLYSLLVWGGVMWEFTTGYFTSVDHIESSFLEKPCCLAAFLRGVYLSCGSMSDPNKDYHLDFAVFRQSLCQELVRVLAQAGFPPKTSVRKGNSIVYFTESGVMEDFLTFIGAVGASLELMNIKIYKDVRNKVNRVTNCETANIEKTVEASTAQIEDIQLLMSRSGVWESLPQQLKELALLRTENPELSLRELGQLLSPPISRSGVNHRLQRIKQAAEQLRTAQGKDKRGETGT